ncbi:MAG: tRNA nucleotidyltransferase [Eubacteriales bacterium]|nr:tRNA nucleotidyltransferase [Eubacteriales bacterium]
MQWNDLPQQARRTLEQLEQAGFEAALVGGCVRDRLMGRTPGDYDIATSASPEQMQAVFAGEKLLLTGLRHGTVTLLREGMPLEITAFRLDGAYSDMRRPDSVRFTRSLREDVLRRDFTMNALAWELRAGLIDHTGGQEDILRRRIRAVGEPGRRFTEDALRILRAVRFAAQLSFDIEPDTERALFLLHGHVAHVAAERVRVELEKTLLGPAAAPVLRRYGEILRPRLPGAEALSAAQWEESALRVQALQPFAGGRALLLWAALLLPLGSEKATEALAALRADKVTIRGVQKRLEMAAQPAETLYALRCMAGDNGLQAAREAVLLRCAFCEPERSAALALLDRITREELPCSLAQLAVGGDELLAAGASGRQVGALLHALLDAVRAERLPNRKDALLAEAKRLLL